MLRTVRHWVRWHWKFQRDKQSSDAILSDIKEKRGYADSERQDTVSVEDAFKHNTSGNRIQDPTPF